MKRICALLLVLLSVLCFMAGCGQSAGAIKIEEVADVEDDYGTEYKYFFVSFEIPETTMYAISCYSRKQYVPVKSEYDKCTDATLGEKYYQEDLEYANRCSQEWNLQEMWLDYDYNCKYQEVRGILRKGMKINVCIYFRPGVMYCITDYTVKFEVTIKGEIKTYSKQIYSEPLRD